MPPLRDPAAATPADFAFCRDALRRGSRSFLAASLLLPARVRAPAAALYAFCREADDAVDLACVPDLAPLRDRLDRAYAGRPRPGPVDRAFAEVVARFAIPRALFDALLEGFAWDAEGRRYEDFADLGAYAARVAGSVGAMMAVLMGVRAPEKLARACDLGTAMQLTNIARDIGEDARAGRRRRHARARDGPAAGGRPVPGRRRGMRAPGHDPAPPADLAPDRRPDRLDRGAVRAAGTAASARGRPFRAAEALNGQDDQSRCPWPSYRAAAAARWPVMSSPASGRSAIPTGAASRDTQATIRKATL